MRILCLPAHDRADEVIAAMLAQVLEQKGLAAMSFPIVGPSSNEWIALIEAGRSDLVCISALPPYAFAPARAMCKQIRERFPKLKVVVGVWGFSGDKQKAKARFERTQPDRLSTSIAEAVEHVQELVGPKPEANSAKPEATPLVACQITKAVENSYAQAGSSPCSGPSPNAHPTSGVKAAVNMAYLALHGGGRNAVNNVTRLHGKVSVAF